MIPLLPCQFLQAAPVVAPDVAPYTHTGADNIVRRTRSIRAFLKSLASAFVRLGSFILRSNGIKRHYIRRPEICLRLAIPPQVCRRHRLGHDGHGLPRDENNRLIDASLHNLERDAHTAVRGSAVIVLL